MALTVDRDVAGAHALGDLEGAVDVAAAHLAGQAVDGVVGDGDRFVVGVVRGDRQHRAEDLLLRHLRIRVDVGEQRGLRVVADRQVLRNAAAGDKPRTRIDATLDKISVAILHGEHGKRLHPHPLVRKHRVHAGDFEKRRVARAQRNRQIGREVFVEPEPFGIRQHVLGAERVHHADGRHIARFLQRVPKA